MGIMINNISSSLYGILNLIFPSGCPLCGTRMINTAANMCSDCCKKLSSEPYLKHSFQIDDFLKIWSCRSYAGVTRECIRQIKYRGKTGLISRIRKIVDTYFGISSGGLRERTIDIIIPVPSHPIRRKKRTADHVVLIAKAVLQYFPKAEFREHLLFKRINTIPQAELSRKERLNNLKESFGIYHADKISGKHILLIDDVVTTGTTIKTCTQILYNSGGASVTGFTIARSF